MRALNEAIEGAAAFSDMMDKLTKRAAPARRADIVQEPRAFDSRQERRARERAEKKAALRAARATR